MHVVSYAEAARQAGVSRQAINDLKKANQSQKGKYPFFLHSPLNGKPGIDIESSHWLDYLNRNQVKRVRMNQEKPPKNDNKNAVMSSETDNSAEKEQFIDACLDAVKEIFKPSVEKMDLFITKIQIIMESK